MSMGHLLRLLHLLHLLLLHLAHRLLRLGLNIHMPKLRGKWIILWHMSSRTSHSNWLSTYRLSTYRLSAHRLGAHRRSGH
jgi:hypothetical protein